MGTLEQWLEAGDYLGLAEGRLFYRDSGGTLPPLLYLHGYPSASIDLHRVWDLLGAKHRVIACDHPGFGFSDKPASKAYSLFEQAESVLELLDHLDPGPLHLVAHDYGTSIATELAARLRHGESRLKLRSLTLCNGSVHLQLAKPRMIQWLLAHPRTGPWVARRVGKPTLARNFRAIWGERPPQPEDIEQTWALLERENGRLILPRLTGYLYERRRFHARWIGALEALDLPALILWGDRDPIATPAVARGLHENLSGSEIRWLNGVGHYPMLETPDRWAEALLGFTTSFHASPSASSS